MGKKLSKEEFVKRARAIHGGKYDYSEVEYVDAITYVKIKCPIHGFFMQRPVSHVNAKQQCPKCAHQSYKKEQDEFIEQAKAIYGEKYTYEKVDYKSNKDRVVVTCKKHGDFEIRPDNFLHGHGCFKCGLEKSAQTRALTLEQFIEKAKSIYGDKYTYENAVYKNSETYITITCKKHGDFEITPDNFLRGHSCPHCSKSFMELRVKGILDENHINYEEQKQFEWLKDRGKLKLDFYLPDYNIAIECQGLQHFKPVEIFGGEDNFVLTQKRDETKKELCEKNGIKLLYFSDIKEKVPKNTIKKKDKLINEIYGKQN